jgi:hypothetical protein
MWQADPTPITADEIVATFLSLQSGAALCDGCLAREVGMARVSVSSVAARVARSASFQRSTFTCCDCGALRTGTRALTGPLARDAASGQERRAA